MQFITALRDTCFTNPVYGPGTLKKGRTYYTFGHFAHETEQQGLVRILDHDPVSILRFRPEHLDRAGKPRRILLLFTGGLGDAVTISTVLPSVMQQYNLRFDICGARQKWDDIFLPMGQTGRHVPFPPDLETLAAYDAILCDITDFFHTPDGLKISPVLQLFRGFRLESPLIQPSYRIPNEILEKMRLPVQHSKKIGLHLDSNGAVKSYPIALYTPLFKALEALKVEIHLWGKKSENHDHTGQEGFSNWREKTTVPELAALVMQMDLVLGVDSFTVHLANLFHKPIIVLLSTTAPSYFAWHRHITCLQSRLECAPCFSVFDQCPAGYVSCKAFEHQSIHPGLIAEQVRDILI